MTTHPVDVAVVVGGPQPPAASGLEMVLRSLSVLTIGVIVRA